jgi:hypothetical protein
MPKFGRFELGKQQPIETFDGDFMDLERGHVKIMRGSPGVFLDVPCAETIAVIDLASGQSVKEIKNTQKRCVRLSHRRR